MSSSVGPAAGKRWLASGGWQTEAGRPATAVKRIQRLFTWAWISSMVTIITEDMVMVNTNNKFVQHHIDLFAQDCTHTHACAYMHVLLKGSYKVPYQVS